MKILILANSRYKGGLSGGDAIYENFKKHWPHEVVVHEMQQIDYLPFFICYCQRIIVGMWRAWLDTDKYGFVYSSSDFLPDTLPAMVYRLKGNRWVAGFFLKAFRDNPVHYYSQKVVKKLIDWFADMVIVTNPTMYDLFLGKKKTWINGGIDLSLAGEGYEIKTYDAVFCGRIHPSKGIDELIDIWDLVRREKPNAKLAIIGDGDLGKAYVKNKLFMNHGKHNYNGVTLMGYMGDERYEIYKQSKVVLYPTPLKYDHFSMAPVEAMACGCKMISFNTPICRKILRDISMPMTMANSIEDFSSILIYHLDIRNPNYFTYQDRCIQWAQQYDYKTQSLRVLKEIDENINYRTWWNVRDILKRSS